MENESAGRAVRLGIVALVVVLVLGGGAWWFTSHKSVAMTTPYQAVLLSNGSAYFGQLQGLGTPYPVLTNGFYVKSTQDPNTKAVSNTLVKRGREWHAPHRIILNANMIVLVEPVNPASRVAQLLAHATNP